MLIQILPGVRVFMTDPEIALLKKVFDLPYFRNTTLQPEEIHLAKLLADKSILVRKKLDTDVQYALNKRIRFEKYGFKKKQK